MSKSDGRYIQIRLLDIPPRIKEIEEGKYDAELDHLTKLDTEKLRALYKGNSGRQENHLVREVCVAKGVEYEIREVICY